MTTAVLGSNDMAPKILRVSGGGGGGSRERCLPRTLAFMSVPAAQYDAVGAAKRWWFAHPTGRPSQPLCADNTHSDLRTRTDFFSWVCLNIKDS